MHYNTFCCPRNNILKKDHIVIFVIVWYGVIFIRSGLYEGGIFRFTLSLPEKFPDDEVPVSILRINPQLDKFTYYYYFLSFCRY